MGNVMNKIGKVILGIVIFVYAIIAVLLTLCLFNINDKGIAEFDYKTSVLSLQENFSSEYKEGDLVVVSKDSISKSDVKVGDGIFYYLVDENYAVEYGVVTNVLEDAGDNIFVVGEDYNVYFNAFIGYKIKKIGHLGKLYDILTSQFGYLAFIILPTLIAVVVEIYAVIIEIIAIKNDVKRANGAFKTEAEIIKEYEAKLAAQKMNEAPVRTEEDIIREYEERKKAEAEAAKEKIKTEEDIIREYEERKAKEQERVVEAKEELKEQPKIEEIIKKHEEEPIKEEPKKITEEDIIKEFEERLKTTKPEDQEKLIKEYEEKLRALKK